MKIPPAPQSRRAGISMVLFSLFLIATGIDKVFDLMVANCTEKILSEGEIDVETTLLFKNPHFRPAGPVPLSRLRSWQR